MNKEDSPQRAGSEGVPSSSEWKPEKTVVDCRKRTSWGDEGHMEEDEIADDGREERRERVEAQGMGSF